MATDANLKLSDELADSVALGEYVNALLAVKEPKMSSEAGQEALEEFEAKVLEFGMKYKRELRSCSAEQDRPDKKVAGE